MFALSNKSSSGPDSTRKKPASFGNAEMMPPDSTRKTSGVVKQITILVVDDDPTNISTNSRILRSEGFSVKGAPSGEEALKAFGKGKFDIVLSDCDMPGINGLELIAKLKEADNNVRFILMTGHAQPERIQAAMDAGAVCVLSKPFDAGKLLATVQVALAAEPADSTGTGSIAPSSKA